VSLFIPSTYVAQLAWACNEMSSFQQTDTHRVWGMRMTIKPTKRTHPWKQVVQCSDRANASEDSRLDQKLDYIQLTAVDCSTQRCALGPLLPVSKVG
jgi:hypothetical protein